MARNTVRRYLTDRPPVQRQTPERKCPVTDAVRPRLHELLAEAPRWTCGKQRLTSTRLHELLVVEGYKISARMVPGKVADWKRQPAGGVAPLMYQPGDLAGGFCRGAGRRAWAAAEG